MRQPENGKVYSLGHYVAVRSATIDWFMCVICEVNDPSKEIKARFMRRSGQYFLLSKNLEKWFPSQQDVTDAPYHPFTIACVIPLMPSTLKVSDKMIQTLERDFKMDLHICTKKEVVNIEKIELLAVAFLRNY